MTDKDIIKALEQEIHLTEYADSDYADVKLEIIKSALKLIYRQKAEIERLEKTEIEIDDFCRRLCHMRMLNGSAIASYEDLQNYIKEEKSKAITEFAERLKEYATQGFWETDAYIGTEQIDNLVKEMAGNAE